MIILMPAIEPIILVAVPLIEVAVPIVAAPMWIELIKLVEQAQSITTGDTLRNNMMKQRIIKIESEIGVNKNIRMKMDGLNPVVHGGEPLKGMMMNGLKEVLL